MSNHLDDLIESICRMTIYLARADVKSKPTIEFHDLDSWGRFAYEVSRDVSPMSLLEPINVGTTTSFTLHGIEFKLGDDVKPRTFYYFHEPIDTEWWMGVLEKNAEYAAQEIEDGR